MGLEGRLVERGLASSGQLKKAYRSRKVCTCVIDLNDVISVDRAGETAFARYVKKGCAIHSNGLYIRHVLETLKMNGKPRCLDDPPLF